MAKHHAIRTGGLETGGTPRTFLVTPALPRDGKSFEKRRIRS
jgi:hypothetical protein